MEAGLMAHLPAVVAGKTLQGLAAAPGYRSRRARTARAAGVSRAAAQGGCTLGGLEDRLREVNRLKPQLAATATAAMEADHPLERAWARQVRHT